MSDRDDEPGGRGAGSPTGPYDSDADPRDVDPRDVDPDAEDSPAARRRARIAGGFIREVIIFHVGVLIGVLWHLFASEAPVTGEAHIIVVLSIIILCMARFIQLMKM